MATNKKPRKPHRRCHAGGHLPLPIPKAQKMETQALMALNALQGGFFNSELGLELSIFLTSFESLSLTPDEIEDRLIPAMRCMASIADRHTRTGKWGCNGEELLTLRYCLPWLASKWVSRSRGEVADAQFKAEKIYLKVFDKP